MEPFISGDLRPALPYQQGPVRSLNTPQPCAPAPVTYGSCGVDKASFEKSFEKFAEKIPEEKLNCEKGFPEKSAHEKLAPEKLNLEKPTEKFSLKAENEKLWDKGCFEKQGEKDMEKMSVEKQSFKAENEKFGDKQMEKQSIEKCQEKWTREKYGFEKGEETKLTIKPEHEKLGDKGQEKLNCEKGVELQEKMAIEKNPEKMSLEKGSLLEKLCDTKMTIKPENEKLGDKVLECISFDATNLSWGGLAGAGSLSQRFFF